MSRRWHTPRCRRPDVHVVGGAPYCSTCDSLADSSSVQPDSGPGIPPVPELPPEGIRNLSWPSSVDYHRDADDPSPPAPPPLALAGSAPPAQPNPAAVAQGSKDTYYTPLESTNHIRLLRLSNGNFTDPIHGTLITASLESVVDELKFDALSYAWADENGDASRRQVIFLGPSWDMFKVTANCFAALRRMREEATRDRLVWVDAVCIDQGNHAERNAQVGLMARIYSSARQLFVYLGEGDGKLEEAVKNLNWSELAKSIDPELVRRVFRCRYFSRMWIIQEVANARTAAVIHYGASRIPWAAMGEDRLVSIFGPTAVQAIQVPTWITTIYRHPWYSADLARLLSHTAQSQAADPRDRIFALFGLLKDAASNALVADYTLSLPEVLTGYAAFSLLNLNRPWMLDYAICNNTRKLPTWVPDWWEDPSRVDPDGKHPLTWRPAGDASSSGPEPVDRPATGSCLRISNSGCLTIPAIAIIDSCSWAFELFWARLSNPFEPGDGSSKPSTTPPGRVVTFQGTNSIFYLTPIQGRPLRYKIFGRISFGYGPRRALQRVSQDSSVFDGLRGVCHNPHMHKGVRRGRVVAWSDSTEADPVPTLDQALDGFLGRERRTVPWPPGLSIPARRELYEVRNNITAGIVPNPISTPTPLLERIRVWETEAFWDDVAVAVEMHSMWRSWIHLTSILSAAPGPRGKRQKQEVKDLTDVLQPHMLDRWATDTSALVERVSGQEANDFYRKEPLRLRIGGVVLDFFPSDDISVLSMVGMTAQQLRGLVLARLTDWLRGSAGVPTPARASSEDDGLKFLDHSSCEAFFKRCSLPDKDEARELKAFIVNTAFAQAVSPGKRVWEEVTIC